MRNCSHRQAAIGIALALSLFFPAMPALAQLSCSDASNGIIGPSVATSLPHDGDPAGVRKWLGEHGILFRLIYANDVLSNLSGGKKRGTIDQGLLEGALAVDFGKLAGWQGLSLYSNAFQIHNTGRMRRDYVDGINTIAAIEAVPTTRLSELWLEQKFLDDAASIRVGQLAADVIFFFSTSSAMFLQSDWPTITAADLPSGGPAYPLSTPGARLQVDPNKNLSLLLGVFNGDPAGPGPGGPGDDQVRDPHGLNFRLSDPPLIMGEGQFRYNQGKDDRFPGALKIGAWGHLREFDDQRFAADSSLLADPLGSGIPAMHRGDFGIYGVIDQQIYRAPGDDPTRGISVFSRASLSPSDRNLIDRYIDGGIVFAGLVPNRPDDRFGASVIYSRFSDRVRAFDRDRIVFGEGTGSVRDYEANLEITYVAQVIPGWTVQPDFQYVRHPSGQSGHDAKVVGIRLKWQF